jgi:hypothetical protein
VAKWKAPTVGVSTRGPKSKENEAKIKIVDEALKIARGYYGSDDFGVDLDDVIAQYPTDFILLEAGGDKYVCVENGGTKGAALVVDDGDDANERVSHSSKINKMTSMI